MQKLPDGVECQLNVFLFSESTDIEVMVSVKGLPAFPDASTIDPLRMAIELGGGALARTANDWRVMTREEIADYKRRESE